MKSVPALFLSLPLCFAACGGSPPPKAEEAPAPPAHEEPAPEKAPSPSVGMSGELGQIDPQAVKQTFASLAPKFEACQTRGIKRVELLSGTVDFFVRVSSTGSVKWLYLADSDLGDRETEHCLLDVVSNAVFPKPDQGEAEVRNSLELPSQAARPANEWPEEKVAGVLAKKRGPLDKCTSGSAGPFSVTVYIGEGGKVLSAGASVPNQRDTAKADCVAKTIRELKGFPSPGSWPAKVTFKL